VINRVAVTGIGIATPFGFGEAAVVRSILAGRHGFRPVTRFDTRLFRTSYAAESEFGGSLAELGIRCAEEALQDAGSPDIRDAVLVLGIAGDYDALQAYWRSKQSAGETDRRILEFMPAYQANLLATRFGMVGTGQRICLNNACIASSNAIGLGYELIAQGKTDIVLCGGYSLVTEEMFAKFNSGRAFAADGRVRAFSANRSGMLLGDGGAMLVLENLARARQRKAAIKAEMIGWGLSCDAFHVCQPHPEGAGMAHAISKALAKASITSRELDYINAHGTGTLHNDRSETLALKKALGEEAYRIPVSSTKSMTGHILEGTGAVETAISIIAMNRNIIPPTAGYEQRDPQCELDYVPNEPRSSSLNTVMNVNASFGGNNIAIVLQKIKAEKE
jgi:3-oxoacyl-[acyl-carrier-protein] synthase II